MDKIIIKFIYKKQIKNNQKVKENHEFINCVQKFIVGFYGRIQTRKIQKNH